MKGEQHLFQLWQNFSLLRNKKKRRVQAVKKSLCKLQELRHSKEVWASNGLQQTIHMHLLPEKSIMQLSEHSSADIVFDG